MSADFQIFTPLPGARRLPDAAERDPGTLPRALAEAGGLLLIQGMQAMADAMQAKLEAQDAKAPHEKREQGVEPVLGTTRSATGPRRFSPRGIGKAATAWTLVTPAHNCKRTVTLEPA